MLGVSTAAIGRIEVGDTGWWIGIFPGIAIVLAGVGFSLVGDSIADLFRRRG